MKSRKALIALGTTMILGAPFAAFADVTWITTNDEPGSRIIPVFRSQSSTTGWPCSFHVPAASRLPAGENDREIAARSGNGDRGRMVGKSQRGLVQFTHGAFATLEHVAHISQWYDTILQETRRPLIGESIRHRWSEPELWRKQLHDVKRAPVRATPPTP